MESTTGAPSPGKARSVFKNIIRKALLVLLGIALGAFIAEIALRIGGYSYPQFYAPDPVLGYSLRPNVEGWYREEGGSYVVINSDGLRDREHEKTKPANTFRIAVVGDSYAEALQVPMEDAFWIILEKKLNECRIFGDKRVEVINFGVSGYGTAQELLMLRERVWQYSPDMVVLAVTTNNDVTDNVRILKASNDIPYFVLQDGKLTLDDSFKNTRAFRTRQSSLSRLGRWIHDHSRLIQGIRAANRKFKYWRTASRPHSIPDTQQNAAPMDEPGIENVIYRQPNDKVWDNAWQVTEALILQMRDEVNAKGAQFVVVTLSNGIQVYPDSKIREAFMKRLGVSDLFYPDNRIQQLCNRERIPAIILAPRLQEYADRNNVFLHGFDDKGNGHWNRLGHQVAGELIANKMCAEVSR